jgi:4'-phosphopantetheinyl transferase
MMDWAFRRGPSPETLVLGHDEIHVWRASLDLPTSRVQALQHTLAEDELERAERYNFRTDRNRFVVARGLLRDILSHYLGVGAGQVRFCYGSHGKPRLAPELDGGRLRFNMAHSDGLALIAVARDREIGIDVERVRLDPANQEIAERFFSPGEIAALHGLPAGIQLRAFFTCWTRKEAYLKARGKGLALPLDQFGVSLAPGRPAALLSADGEPQEDCRWSMQDLDPGASYVGALAAEGHSWQLKCWQMMW